MNTLEIEYCQELENLHIICNGESINQSHNCKSLTADIKCLPANIIVEFKPLKIKPLVRYNGFLLDYWLANITQYDHQLKFVLTETFCQDYKNKNIQGRIDSLNLTQKSSEDVWDKYIGINNPHHDLVQEIRRYIAQ